MYEVHRDLLGAFKSAYKLCNKRVSSEDLIKAVKKFHEGLTNYRKKVGVVHHRVRKTLVIRSRYQKFNFSRP